MSHCLIRRRMCLLILALIILVFAVGRAGAFELRLSGEKLTLSADRVPLQTILLRFSDLGVTVRIDPGINPEITASIEDQDVQKGLATVLKTLSYSLVWTSIQGPTGPLIKLSEIQIFRPGEMECAQPLVARRTLELVSNPVDGSSFVRNEILLRLSPEVDKAAFEALLRRIGGSVVECDTSTGVYRIVLAKDTNIPSLVGRLRNYPGVATAEPNFAYPVAAPFTGQPATAPSSETQKKSAPTGAAPIAVLDSGLTRTAGLDELVVADFNAIQPGEPLSDSLGHGTQMALIAAGIVTPSGTAAPSDTTVPIMPIRIFDDNGYTSNFDLMKSIDFAVSQGARVMSLSWGTETRSAFLERALDYADAKGLIVVASAGNEPTGRPVYPAAYASVIGVGALNPEGKAWKRSNYGDFVTIYAPGFATLPVGYKGDPGDYAGTSISAAFVAHTIADYLTRNPTASKQDALTALSK